MKQRSCKIKYVICLAGRSLLGPLASDQLWHCTSYGTHIKNVMSHVDPYLHIHHLRYLLCLSIKYVIWYVIVAGWQETFRSAASWLAGDFWVSANRLAADLKVSCQPAGRRHFPYFNCWNIFVTFNCEKVNRKVQGVPQSQTYNADLSHINSIIQVISGHP